MKKTALGPALVFLCLISAGHAKDAEEVSRKKGLWAASIGPLSVISYSQEFGFMRETLEHHIAHPRLHYFLNPRVSIEGELYIEWDFDMSIGDQFSGLGLSRNGGVIVDVRFNPLTLPFTPTVVLGLGGVAGSLGGNTTVYLDEEEQESLTFMIGPGLNWRAGLGWELLHKRGLFLLMTAIVDAPIIPGHVSIVSGPDIPQEDLRYILGLEDQSLVFSLLVGKAFRF